MRSKTDVDTEMKRQRITWQRHSATLADWFILGCATKLKHSAACRLVHLGTPGSLYHKAGSVGESVIRPACTKRTNARLIQAGFEFCFEKLLGVQKEKK